MDRKISKEKIVVDTNIFLEFLLHQDRTAESLFLMKKIEEGTVEAYMTGYTLHSIAFTLDRRKQPKLLKEFSHSTEFSGGTPTPFVIPLPLCSLTPILGHHLQRPSDQRVTHAQHRSPDPRKPDSHHRFPERSDLLSAAW